MSIPCQRLKAIAFSMDALIPGLFIWFGSLKIGSEAEETYSGTIYSFAGMALVLPGYRIIAPIGEPMTLDKHQSDNYITNN